MLHCFCKCCCCQWDDRRVVPANMSLELSELFARELTRVSIYIFSGLLDWFPYCCFPMIVCGWEQYIEETEELAIKGLSENRHILDAITDKLLEDSRITGLVIRQP